MSTTLPIPVQFTLPEGWVAVPPDEADAAGVAFAAVHPDPAHPGFTANITISGEYRADKATLVEIAAESVDRLTRTAEAVAVTRRVAVGSADAPGLTQVVRLKHVVDGVAQELSQCQVYLDMHDVEDERKRAVIQLALTATTQQLDGVIGDFQRFVSTVRPKNVS